LKSFALADFLEIACQISNALAFAQTNRVTHGNLRPTNILFDEAGTAKVTDFGLDEHYGDPADEENWYQSGEPTEAVNNDIFCCRGGLSSDADW